MLVFFEMYMLTSRNCVKTDAHRRLFRHFLEIDKKKDMQDNQPVIFQKLR